MTHILFDSHLRPFPCDPDEFTGMGVAALYVWWPDQIHAVHIMDLPLVVVHTLQGALPVARSA